MCQYLSMDRQERQKTAGERDRIKTLVSDISHQTKTPVANILLYIQLLLEHPGLDDEAGRIAGQIEAQTKKLDDIKHEGEQTFNYESEKLPIHLAAELKIIDEALNWANDKIFTVKVINNGGAYNHT